MQERAQIPQAGQPERLAEGLVRVLAPNPSPMTLHGTNSYLLGEDVLAVIDPGPNDPAHLAALEAAIDGRPVTHVLVTHSHLDHSPLAPLLAARLDAPVCAFGPHDAGRRPVMVRLAAGGLIGGGEGIDAAFRPDVSLADGALLNGPWGQIEAVHLPGHIANHLGFAWGDALFSGDHVMGWASSLVSPPDGDLTAFMASCDRLLTRPETVYHPGHGAPIPDGKARTRWLMTHRAQRTAQLLEALAEASGDLQSLTLRVYTDIDRRMLPAAARNLLAHLIALEEQGKIKAMPHLSADAIFTRI
jgi:glyoxylase-like metal-dependent hydrolase (beta-lactamase superfamily II)